jgi:succinate dehydrogenase / fumarate reductase flavoprotein subunit
MVRKFEFWDFLGLVSTTRAVRGIVAQDLKTMQIEAFPATRCASRRAARASSSGAARTASSTPAPPPAPSRTARARATQRRVHPGAPDGHPGRRQAAPHLRERARRGRARVGPQGPARSAAGKDVPEKERDYFLESVPRVRQPRPARHRLARALPQRASTRQGVFNPKSGKNELEVYLDLTHKGEPTLRNKLAGILEIYEKFAARTRTTTR